MTTTCCPLDMIEKFIQIDMSKATVKTMHMSMPKEEIIGMVLEMFDAQSK